MTFEMRDLAWLLTGANVGMLLARLIDAVASWSARVADRRRSTSAPLEKP